MELIPVHGLASSIVMVAASPVLPTHVEEEPPERHCTLVVQTPAQRLSISLKKELVSSVLLVSERQ